MVEHNMTVQVKLGQPWKWIDKQLERIENTFSTRIVFADFPRDVLSEETLTNAARKGWSVTAHKGSTTRLVRSFQPASRLASDRDLMSQSAIQLQGVLSRSGIPNSWIQRLGVLNTYELESGRPIGSRRWYFGQTPIRVERTWGRLLLASYGFEILCSFIYAAFLPSNFSQRDTSILHVFGLVWSLTPRHIFAVTCSLLLATVMAHVTYKGFSAIRSSKRDGRASLIITTLAAWALSILVLAIVPPVVSVTPGNPWQKLVGFILVFWLLLIFARIPQMLHAWGRSAQLLGNIPAAAILVAATSATITSIQYAFAEGLGAPGSKAQLPLLAILSISSKSFGVALTIGLLTLPVISLTGIFEDIVGKVLIVTTLAFLAIAGWAGAIRSAYGSGAAILSGPIKGEYSNYGTSRLCVSKPNPAWHSNFVRVVPFDTGYAIIPLNFFSRKDAHRKNPENDNHLYQEQKIRPVFLESERPAGVTVVADVGDCNGIFRSLGE